MKSPEGASLLAKDANGDAGRLNQRGVWAFLVGTPPGANSLPQVILLALHWYSPFTTEEAEPVHQAFKG